MLLVREIFTARPGQAGKLARLLREAASKFGPADVRVMTDLIGRMNTVVMETLMPDLLTFESRMRDYASNVELREFMAGYTELYAHGRREIYQITE